MALFVWNDSYSVKVNRCDQDHQKLFSILNSLHEAMRVGKGSAIIATVLDELSDYTNVHFQAEEGLLQQSKYPGLRPHQAEHKKFVDRINEFQTDLSAGIGTSISVVEFLKDWLATHIKKIDQQYSAHLNAAGIK